MKTNWHFYNDSHSSQNKKCFGHVAEKIESHIFGSITIFPENRTVYEIMQKNTVEPCRPQMEIRRMLIVCWVPGATNTHSEYTGLFEMIVGVLTTCHTKYT